jgi:transposase-like protein
MNEMKCPECGSNNLVKFGKKFAKDKETGERVKNQQFQCKDCGRITVKPNAT